MDEGRGHLAADEAAGGSGEGAATANKSTGPPRGDAVCVDEAEWTAEGNVIADLAATGEGERCCRRGGGYGTAAGVIASVENSA